MQSPQKRAMVDKESNRCRESERRMKGARLGARPPRGTAKNAKSAPSDTCRRPSSSISSGWSLKSHWKLAIFSQLQLNTAMALTRQSKKREVEPEPVEQSPSAEHVSKDTAINLPDIEVSLQVFF